MTVVIASKEATHAIRYDIRIYNIIYIYIFTYIHIDISDFSLLGSFFLNFPEG